MGQSYLIAHGGKIVLISKNFDYFPTNVTYSALAIQPLDFLDQEVFHLTFSDLT